MPSPRRSLRPSADWPDERQPVNPEAWLLTAARRKSIDARSPPSERRGGDRPTADPGRGTGFCRGRRADAEIPDNRLALMFASAHPAIEPGIRAPLMLQVVLGLDAETIAAAFLTSPAAMGKRLVRAKDKIRPRRHTLPRPRARRIPGRLDAVLEAIYAAFAEGWNDPGGTDVVRRDLSGEAVYLARLVVELMPEAAEPMGLLALMLHAEARRHARRSRAGEYVPFAEQDPGLWDWPMIAEAEALLRRAASRATIGRYQLEAALQSAHVDRRRSGEANWASGGELYDALAALTGSPVVAINRALAIAETRGAASALAAMPDAGRRPAPRRVPAILGRARRASGKDRRGCEARAAYDIAIGLEPDAAVRRFLGERRAAVPGKSRVNQSGSTT